MTRNPHSEFLKYHGYADVSQSTILPTDIEILRSEVAEIKVTIQLVLQELRQLNA